jgi:tetratricopeptide (TPR) repeat protein
MMRTLVLVMGVALAGSVGTAHAQDDDDDATPEPPPDEAAAKEKARQFMDAGDKLMAKGDSYARKRKPDTAKAKAHYERALEAYSRAYDSFPSPKIYWLIGLAEQKLEKHLDALRHFQQVIREETNLSAELKTQIEAAIEDSKSNVVTVTFKVEPPGARITVDDDELGTAPYEDPVFLAPGKHTIAITFEGHSPFEEEVDLEAGQESERTITLEKIPVIVKKPRKKPRKEETPTVSKGPLWAGIIFTGGFAGLATITGLMAVGKHGTFSDESASPDERESARSSGKNLALVSDLLWVGAIGAGAYTAYYYYKVYKPKKARLERELSGQAQASWVAPWADGQGAGVAWGGSF